ncbi:MAG TPA: hypothetical protein VFI96_01455, partial [Longimicrobiaceae bacterium]|nr:hypothetical protein [Longimicrobiaceae bacterium]
MVQPLVVIGSPAEDSLRTAQLLGRAPLDGFLLRSPSLLTPPLPGDSTTGRMTWALIAPELYSTWNSFLPYSFNDGSRWAGRGLNVQVRSGVRFESGRFSVVVAPELIYAQNLDFPHIDNPKGNRSTFAARWHTEAISIDLPWRFGDRRRLSLAPGQSSLSIETGPVTFGLATENAWWGPGIRNAIVMSNNAGGVPRLFLR